jgi:hypothetical protein
VKARQCLTAALDSGEPINGVLFAEKESTRAQASKQVVYEHPFEGRYSGIS